MAGASSSTPTVTTTAHQTYGDLATADLVTLGQGTHLSGDDITFDSRISGARDLGRSAAGAIALRGEVGDSASGLTPLGDGSGAALSIEAASSVVMERELETSSGIEVAAGVGTVTLRESLDLGEGDTDTVLNADVVLEQYLAERD